MQCTFLLLTFLFNHFDSSPSDWPLCSDLLPVHLLFLSLFPSYLWNFLLLLSTSKMRSLGAAVISSPILTIVSISIRSILSVIFPLDGLSISCWCFTSNSLVFSSFYTWILGSIRNFTGVLSGSSFYLFCIIILISSQEHLGHIKSSLCQNQACNISSLSLSLSIFIHSFSIITFIIWIYTSTTPFLSQMWAIAHYLSAFYYVQEENIII